MWHEILYLVLNIINFLILFLIGFSLLWQLFYVLFSFVKKKTYKKSEKLGRIAIIIPARNESAVIYNTVDSLLKNQKYPKELYDVYVVVNNTTDNTAELAKKAGAIVLNYVDDDPSHKMAAYPLKYAYDHVLKLNKYDFVIRFDADNHGNDEFLSYMNDAYQSGVDFGRPYEGAINGPQNLFTKTCAVFYSYDSRFGSRIRERLGISAHINGSGCMISTKLLKQTNGYDCKTKSEDAEYCFDVMLKGVKGHFVEDAVLHEDMPSTFKDTVNRNNRIASGGMGLLKTKLLKMLGKFFVTGNVSFLEIFCAYLFNFISILVVVWIPLFYIYNFLYLGFIEAGIISTIYMSAAFYHTVLFNTIWSIIGVIGGLYLIMCIYGVSVIVFTSYKNLGATKPSQLANIILLFPIGVLIYGLTFCSGALSKHKGWTEINRNTDGRIEPAKKNDNILIIEHLMKSYDGLTYAVNDVSLNVKRGGLFAFLGMNGAGKSTTINIICSILSKDSGKVYVDGFDLDHNAERIKSEIGIVFQNSVLDKELTVEENLNIRTSFYSLSKKEKTENINNIIKLLDLKPILKKPIKSLSGGQKRRVDIARAMVHSPKLLILDEPTTGLDPKTRLIVWSLIDKIRSETGMTVFLTTHYLEEAEKATYVTIMNKGIIIAEGTPIDLKNKYAYDYILTYMKKNSEFEEIMTSLNKRFIYNKDNKAYKVEIRDTANAKELISKFPEYFNDIEVLKGTIDDVFLNVTSNNTTEEENNENKN